MSEEPEIQPEPIRFTQVMVLLVDAWPARTAFTDDWLRRAHVNKATVDGDTVIINADNGTATYRIRRDLPKQGKAWVADLVSGDTPGKLRAAGKKFHAGGVT